MERLEKTAKRTNIKPQVDRFTFAEGNSIIVLAEGRLVNLGCATGHPRSFVAIKLLQESSLLAQIELWKERLGKYPWEGLRSSKELDEKVAALHLKTWV